VSHLGALDPSSILHKTHGHVTFVCLSPRYVRGPYTLHYPSNPNRMWSTFLLIILQASCQATVVTALAPCAFGPRCAPRASHDAGHTTRLYRCLSCDIQHCDSSKPIDTFSHAPNGKWQMRYPRMIDAKAYHGWMYHGYEYRVSGISDSMRRRAHVYIYIDRYLPCTTIHRRIKRSMCVTELDIETTRIVWNSHRTRRLSHKYFLDCIMRSIWGWCMKVLRRLMRMTRNKRVACLDEHEQDQPVVDETHSIHMRSKYIDDRKWWFSWHLMVSSVSPSASVYAFIYIYHYPLFHDDILF
jgi:hypothetical protein